MRPKCSTKAIEEELTRLEAAGFTCAVEYLKIELQRRRASRGNKGRPVSNYTAKAEAARKAARAYRLRKIREIEAEGLALKGEDGRTIVPFDDV